MRSVISFLSCSLLLTATAQVDINKMIQERMAKQGGQTGQPGGAKVEDDTDPFVPNEFIGSFRMEMHMFDGATEKKNSPTNMRYWSTADMTMNKMEMPEGKGQDMRMMTDLKGKWQYTMMQDDKGKKTAMKSRKKKVTLNDDKGGKEPEVTVTAETRTIEGHLCTKTIVRTEEGTWTGWIARDIKAPFGDMARSAGSRGNDRMMKNYNGIQGFPLEFEWVDAKGQERLVCYMKELQVGAVDPSVFSLDGYEVMEMPSFGQ